MTKRTSATPAASGPWSGRRLRLILDELRRHAPFTGLGTATGVAIILAFVLLDAPKALSAGLFWTFHPIHVLLSALVTAGMYRLHGKGRLASTLVIGYLGSIGIATLSDSAIPYAGESLLALPQRELRLGFIEKWWLVNPLAVAGALWAYFRPATMLPHAGHVLLSTWASLFHMTMAFEGGITPAILAGAAVFLFLSVWIPCCASDIAFPLLFARDGGTGHRCG